MLHRMILLRTLVFFAVIAVYAEVVSIVQSALAVPVR